MKKIMFKDKYCLTQAVLDGRKTMTRRIIKEDYTKIIRNYCCRMNGRDIYKFFGEITEEDELITIKPKYKVGETVAVAQAYKKLKKNGKYDNGWCGYFHVLENDNPDVVTIYAEETEGWNNKMFVEADLMPHRIRITGIKAERLQDISDEDCIKEGVMKSFIGYYVPDIKCKDWENESHVDTEDGCTWKLFPDPRTAFAALIDKVSGKRTWESNPWVFAYSFELVKGEKK